MSEASTAMASRPVIIASSRQRRLWPLSTPERPFCIRTNQNGESPLGHILTALTATNKFAPPIIILSEMAARDALPQINRLCPDALVQLVPAGTGSGTAAVLAAMIEVLQAKPLPLALIPASFHAENLVQAFETIAKMASISQTEQRAVVMASRSPSIDLSFSLELGERIPGKTIFSVSSIFADRNPDTASVMSEMGTLVRGCGPVVVPPALLLRRLTDGFPTLASACRNALQMADSAGNVTRPRGDFLRLVGRPGLVQLIAPNLNDLGVYLASDDCHIVQSFRDPSIVKSGKLSSLPVEVCGYNDASVIASEDGILVLRPGHEEQVKVLYQHQPHSEENTNHPQKATRSYIWGSEEILMESDDLQLSKRTIQPKQRLTYDAKANVTRSIAIISGTLKIVLSGAAKVLASGDQVIIPCGPSHILANDGHDPVIFIETTSSAPPIANRLSA